MHLFSNFFYLITTGFSLLDIYFRYRLWGKDQRGARAFLSDQIPHIDQLDSPLQKRINHYLFANAITTDWFAKLHGICVSEQERKAGVLLAAATPIADYMADNLGMTKSEILRIIEKPQNTILELVSSTLYYKAISLHQDRLQFEMYFQKTLEAQDKSLHQRKSNESLSLLKKITWDKGGYALLLYRSVIQKEMTRDEEDAIYQLGGLMQLHNDIFDVYRDYHDAIRTIPLMIKNMHTLEIFYQEEVKKTLHLFQKLSPGTHNYHQFFMLFNLTIQTGFVCIDHYRRLCSATNGILHVEQWSKNQLICDMDTFKNLMKVILGSLGLQSKG